jgi:hypothetical protein
VLLDIEFAIDDEQYKLAQLTHDATGVSEVTDVGVCDVLTNQLNRVDWAENGLTPLRSSVTTRLRAPDGNYAPVNLPADPGVAAPIGLQIS